MGKIIAIANQKGGVLKSTTSQNLACILGSYKDENKQQLYKVLLVDMDGQGSTTQSSGVKLTGDNTITHVLKGTCKAHDAVHHCKYHDIIGADRRLRTIEMSERDPNLLKNAISDIKGRYDFVIVDTPPNMGELLYTTLACADYVIIPVQPRAYDIDALQELVLTITNVKKKHNADLDILGILLTNFANRSNLNKSLAKKVEQIADRLNTIVFTNSIRNNIAAAEAQAKKIPLIDYKYNCNASIDFRGFTGQLLQILKERGAV